MQTTAPAPSKPEVLARGLPLAWGFVLAALLPAALADAQTGQLRIATSATEGRVLVSDGAAFISLPAGHWLQPGDRVLVLPGASAKFESPDGCLLALREPGLWVLSTSGCPDESFTGAARAAPPAGFDGTAFLARTGGLGPIEAESVLDTVGP